MWIFVVALIVCYLLGSISGSLLLGRLRQVDIRRLGSGNAGGTNAFRTQGWRFALAVMLIDVSKGALSAWIGTIASGTAIEPLSGGLSCAMAATFGHIWPIYYGFRGGKGAACLIGAIAVLVPVCVLPLLAIWLLVLVTTGYVGLATIITGVSLIPLTLLLAPASEQSALLLFAVAVAALLIFTHRGNLYRLRHGSEHRFERARLLTRLRRP
jgi:acyl phosphate:glycerol-3-phosphate acyltransferase